MKILIFFSLLVIHSPFLYSKENFITIVKQRHLSPKDKTLNIEKSKSLKAYENQKDIYLYLKKRLSQKTSKLIISEGCQGEITHRFSENFNGWTYGKLKKMKDSPKFDDILTLTPLKVKAYFGKKAKVLCGDNNRLLKRHAEVFSDLRGFTFFYIRLKESINKKPKIYEKYAKALFDKLGAKKNQNALDYAKSKANENLKSFKKIINKRNNSFLNAAKGHLKSNPIIVIGGLHAKDLELRLKKKGIKTIVYTPKGYNPFQENAVQDLEKILTVKSSK